MNPEKKKKVGAGFGVIILNKKGQVLLGKRHPDPDKADSAFRSAGEWSLPGGKLDWGENFEEGARREVKEETGLDIDEPELISVHNCMNEHAHFMTVGFVVKSYKGKPQVMEPDEITEWKWFDFKDLPQPRYFPSFMVIENFLKKKFYIPKQR
jgi:mutator protein MutT